MSEKEFTAFIRAVVSGSIDELQRQHKDGFVDRTFKQKDGGLLRDLTELPWCILFKKCKPIHVAISHRCYEAVYWLIKHGADVNDANNEIKLTPMHCAAATGQVEVLRRLVDIGGHIECSDNEGRTPLHWACISGHCNCVKWLLDTGCCANVTDNAGRRPLHWACAKGHEDCLRSLLCFGCIPDTLDHDGRTPLDYATTNFHSKCVGVLQRELNVRKTEEFQIFHFPDFSLICRKYKINDLNDTIKRVQENVFPLQKPVVICHLEDPKRYLSSNLVAFELVSDNICYHEYIVLDGQTDDNCIESFIVNLRDWEIKIKGRESGLASFKRTKISIKVKKLPDSFAWKKTSLVRLELWNQGCQTAKMTVNMLLVKDVKVKDVKNAFIELLMFIYRIQSQLRAGSGNIKEKALYNLMTTRRRLLIFYDSNQEILCDNDVIGQTNVANSGLMIVFQKSVTELLGAENIMAIGDVDLFKEFILVRCITDDGSCLIVNRSECSNVADIRNTVASNGHVRGRIILVSDNGKLDDETGVNDVDDVIHYAAILPYDNRKFEILDEMGRGGFGVVNRCKIDSDDNQIFAIKRLKSRGHYDFQDHIIEILVAARLGSHERIIKYRQFFEGKSKFGIIMDCMKESLRYHLKNHHPLQEKRIIFFSRQILEGLKYLHDNKVMHRDLKCANILLDDKQSVKLTDFGISKCLSDTLTEARLEGAKSTVGTYRWMAPEVMGLEGKPSYGLNADIWSFGATMVEMITGRPPYAELQDLQAAFKIGQTKTIVYEFPGHLSQQLQEFVSLCIQSIPNDRPNCAKLLMNEIYQRSDK